MTAPDDMSDQVSPENRAIAARLRRARIYRGFETAKEFSDKHGIKQPTYVMHELGKRGLSRSVAANYARILKIRLNWLLEDEGEMVLSSTSSVDAPIMIIGAVQAGNWVEAMEWPVEDRRPVPVASRDPRYPHADHFALVVRGPSMNRFYPDGSIIVCVKYWDISERPQSGHKVVVRRHSDTGQIEATAKELRQDDQGALWLWPCSDHPEHQAPIRADNGEEVEILARIVGAYIPQ